MITRQEMADTIKAARTKKGLTQGEFGRMIGYTTSADKYVRDFENARTYPPYMRIRAISEVLGIPLDKLIP